MSSVMEKKRVMGKKIGMTQLFDEQGHAVPCTVIEIESNVVIQVKTVETDGYNAIQTCTDRVVTKDPRTVEKRVSKPLRGHYKKANVDPRKVMKESRVSNPSQYALGQEIGVETFSQGQFVDATAISKGKGYQGVMKKYNFSGGPAAHGSGFHRHAGSTGMRSTPGHCLPGGKRASQMGNKQVTIQNLEILEIDEKERLLVIRGAVPGPNRGLIVLTSAVKKPNQKNQ